MRSVGDYRHDNSASKILKITQGLSFKVRINISAKNEKQDQEKWGDDDLIGPSMSCYLRKVRVGISKRPLSTGGFDNV